ncbi:uncharacterized protein LOC134755056 [Cydia strobilella]|uniref:uncharacterized protein LOC134755056 n=1 Tax=Cydia strobilella TaxID=1100964 RepID=UPI0030071D61
MLGTPVGPTLKTGGASGDDDSLENSGVMFGSGRHTNAASRQRRSKYFKRQSRVQPEEREVRKQASEPAPPAPGPASTPALRKHESYPQYGGQRRSKYFKRQSRVQPEEREVRKQASEPAPPAPGPASTPALRKHESYPQYGGQRRSKYFKRQSRVQPEEREVRKQASEPAPPAPGPASTPALRKHESYPQYGGQNRTRTLDHEIGSLLIRAVTYIDRQTNAPSASTSFEEAPATRASHTPAVRNGPPLSCNFCWNTVDECGRILRRKTQYHCPECQTNLCIVPCFHEYHEGPDAADASASAAASAR